MSRSPIKFQSPKRRYKLANMTRFVAVLLVLMLTVTAVFVVLGKSHSNDPVKNTAIVVTPTVMPSQEASPTPPPIVVPEGKALAPVVIALDAGHGGRDPGTCSPYNDTLYEKDITLDIEKRAAEYLKQKGINVVLTREGDDHLSDVIKEDLIARAAVANDNDAALFVSVHVNSYDLKYKGAAKVNGMEVYYMNKNEVYDNFTEETYAQTIADEIKKTTNTKFNGTKQANFSVLRNTKMPSVLIETAYITNKDDNNKLASKDYRDKLAQGIANGIEASLKQINAFEYDGGLYVFKEVGE
ncbi:MAG: N-acetylmuramoyl-L-alanine amidase [Clostridia bacterium]|nr:N-acetylmuramoyl-L-alanine amidase [Clostridia bacterium]